MILEQLEDHEEIKNAMMIGLLKKNTEGIFDYVLHGYWLTNPNLYN